MKGDHIMQVQMKVLIGALAVALGGSAFAQSGQAELQAIAEASGLQVRHVQMLLSNSHTAYTTHSLSYDSSAIKLRKAVQEGRVHLVSSKHGPDVDFSAWQQAPDRGLRVDVMTTAAKSTLARTE
jgi:hypothetical protein